MECRCRSGIEGIPAIGFSLSDYEWNADFESIKPFIQ
jgi:5'-nucleotidase